MNTGYIKKHLAEKGTPISDFQAEQIAAKISGFCEEMKEHYPKTDWHFNIQQVGADSFSIEYIHRTTVHIDAQSISPLQ